MVLFVIVGIVSAIVFLIVVFLLLLFSNEDIGGYRAISTIWIEEF